MTVIPLSCQRRRLSYLNSAKCVRCHRYLLECNGFRDEDGADVIWSAAKLAERNLAFRRNEDFRELYMPFDNLFFIGDDGTGDQFAFGITAEGENNRTRLPCRALIGPGSAWEIGATTAEWCQPWCGGWLWT